MDFEKLKSADVNIHIMATGAGAGLQSKLWEIPGSSAYLSGASFPYSPEEQEELLGFMPEHFCSPEAALDLASAAYMKAFKFGGKKPIGIGITATVASEKIHRGEHRVHTAIVMDDKVLAADKTLFKDSGTRQRRDDGTMSDDIALHLLEEALGVLSEDVRSTFLCHSALDLAKKRFLERPYFMANGKRERSFTPKHLNALMPGAYNPPHEGHFGMADMFEQTYGNKTIFQVTINPPHKEELSVQECLKRAKMLQGRDRLFTRNDPFFIDKARRYPNTPIIVGADAVLRLFDPKWGLNVEATLQEFESLGTRFFVNGRMIDGKFMLGRAAISTLPQPLYDRYNHLFLEMDGRWDISSTELRNK